MKYEDIKLFHERCARHFGVVKLSMETNFLMDEVSELREYIEGQDMQSYPLALPELWFTRTHVSTGVKFKDRFGDRNCTGWSSTPFSELNMKAKIRISILNTKMPTEWLYEITGWELNKEKNDASKD